MRTAIEFSFRGRSHQIADAGWRMTLLEWLRTEQSATGTKEGCAEGDCGACTVVLARLEGDRVVHQTVNSCILLVGQAHGSAVLTIEDLARRDGPLHPVQNAMLRHHGSQCGFCTPGIVMSLYALHQDGARPVQRDAVLDQLAGNLCRCTGYRPIVDAAMEACALAANPSPVNLAALQALADDDDILVADATGFFAAPRREAGLQLLLAAHPDALLIAGATDTGLTFTKQLVEPHKIIWLGRVAGLDTITRASSQLSLGATATLAHAYPQLAGLAPDLGEVLRRFGSVQVRTCGTVGGSIANASPIGDLAPCLIALEATLELGSAGGVRSLPLEDYFQAYKKQDRKTGEYIRRILVPVPGRQRAFKAYKISKRLDEDISTLLGAFAFDLDGRRIAAARIAFGGMAGIPARARRTEQALAGASLDDPLSWEAAIAALDTDFAPIDDHRASSAYRRLVAGNLLRKALIELAGTPMTATRILLPREDAHGG